MSIHTRVNSFLAESVSAINALVALGLPLVSALTVGVLAGSVGDGFSVVRFLGGAIVGAVAGALFAGPVCGVLAVLLDIRSGLKTER